MLISSHFSLNNKNNIKKAKRLSPNSLPHTVVRVGRDDEQIQLMAGTAQQFVHALGGEGTAGAAAQLHDARALSEAGALSG